MFGSKAHQKVVYCLIVVSQRTVLLLAEIDKYSGVNAGDAVEDGFGEIHFPLVFPGSNDILHLCICIDDSIGDEFFAFPYFFLIHGEDVECLVEFDSLAKPAIFCVIPVNHKIIR